MSEIVKQLEDVTKHAQVVEKVLNEMAKLLHPNFPMAVQNYARVSGGAMAMIRANIEVVAQQYVKEREKAKEPVVVEPIIVAPEKEANVGDTFEVVKKE